MSLNHLNNVTQLPIANGQNKVRHVFVRDYVVECLIGIYEHEKSNKQRVRINVDLAISEGDLNIEDDIRNVFCYEKLINGIKKIVSLGHLNLVETLAEKVIHMCLKEKDVVSVRVRIEKLDVVNGAESVGIEIERSILNN